MIQTVSDLLEAFIDNATANFPSFSEIQHTVMYGDMFEGLTREFVNKALFAGFDLRVVRGKIRNSKGALTRQIDCMVVVGDGYKIPYTDHYIYQVQHVLMIVEIKKTLYASELESGMALFRHFANEIVEPIGAIDGNALSEKAWRRLFNRNIPSDLGQLTFSELQIYNTLLMEEFFPVRVIFGYSGFSDEFALRKGFIEHLAKICARPLGERPNFNINSFPNLIVCGKSSIIKLDGFPFNGMIRANGFWSCFASLGLQPIRLLIEQLWTRLSCRFDVSQDVFGEDSKVEFRVLCAAKALDLEIGQGWWYETADPSERP